MSFGQTGTTRATVWSSGERARVMRRWLGTALLAGSLAACGGGGVSETADTGVAADAGDDTSSSADTGTVTTPDAGGSDLGIVDAGTRDAGTPDTGTPDAGVLDVGTPDTGTPDAGVLDVGAPDMGTPDVGTPDTGVGCNELTPCDAGRSDAGNPSTDVGTDVRTDVGTDLGTDAGTPQLTARRAGRFSTLGVRAWQSGAVRVVDDEIESSGRLCGSNSGTTVCVSGGFLR
jgi:hypothetical protein